MHLSHTKGMQRLSPFFEDTCDLLVNVPRPCSILQPRCWEKLSLRILRDNPWLSWRHALAGSSKDVWPVRLREQKTNFKMQLSFQSALSLLNLEHSKIHSIIWPLNNIKPDIEPSTRISHAVPASLKSFTTLQVLGTLTVQTPVGCFSTLCERSRVKCAKQPQLGEETNASTSPKKRVF